MNLEKTIQSSFDNYPTIAQLREQVLNHLFCVIGNGYDWIDGELSYGMEDESIYTLDENGKAIQRNRFTDKDEAFRHLEYLFENDGLIDLLLCADSDDLENLGINRNLKKKLNYKGEETLETVSYYPLCKKYSYLFDYPEDIKDDWLDGIIETINLILKEDASSNVFNEISKEQLAIHLENTIEFKNNRKK